MAHLANNYSGRFLFDNLDHLFPWLMFSTVAHLAVILLLSQFGTPASQDPPPPPAMQEIVIDLEPVAPMPENPRAAFLGTRSSEGGSEEDEVVKPESPPPVASRPVTKPPQEKSLPVEKNPVAERTETRQEALQAKNSHTQDRVAEEKEAEKVQKTAAAEPPPPPPMPVVDYAKLDRSLRFQKARDPGRREKVISASTREYRFAAYMQAWVQKVETLGNLNYPAEAKEHKLKDSLILDVAIDPNGHVIEISIIKPSRYPLLDASAKQIVLLGSPYPPFPEEIRKDVDVLHIVRTWHFGIEGK